jgi:hypothetical protein
MGGTYTSAQRPRLWEEGAGQRKSTSTTSSSGPRGLRHWGKLAPALWPSSPAPSLDQQVASQASSSQHRPEHPPRQPHSDDTREPWWWLQLLHVCWDRRRCGRSREGAAAPAQAQAHEHNLAAQVGSLCPAASSWKADSAQSSRKTQQCKSASTRLPPPVGRPGRLGTLGVRLAMALEPTATTHTFLSCSWVALQPTASRRQEGSAYLKTRLCSHSSGEHPSHLKQVLKY